GMVGEFPELQGIMGRHYANHDRERPEVADAIAEHYSPQGPNDTCPSAPVSVAVALADKLDTLVGFFAIGEKPTGSKDPFALRRAALGVIRLVLENEIRLPLTDRLAAQCFRNARRAYLVADSDNQGEVLDNIANGVNDRIALRVWSQKSDKLFDKLNQQYGWEGLENVVLAFFADRLKVLLRDQGKRHDLVDAVFALGD